MYDPVMSTFLSVDAYVQDPTSAQGFNRYAYCSHNPLRYVDPTGWSNQPFGNPNVAPPCNPIKHTTYSSNDANDILLGYSHHPYSSGGQCNGEKVTPIVVTEGNGSNYTVSTTGYVTNVGSNGLNYDMLYTEADWEAGDLSNGLRVNNLTILSDLKVDRNDYYQYDSDGVRQSGHYASTTDIDEAFKVFKFMADNTNVEWEIAGFRTSGHNEYVIGSTHDVSPYGNSSIYEVAGSVTSITSIPSHSSNKEIFCIHSHHGGTMGASEGDINNIIRLYNREYGKEMPNIHQWYKKDGEWTTFPKHYIYHNATQNLYYYTPYEGQSSIFIRNAKSHRDLYRNLGF